MSGLGTLATGDNKTKKEAEKMVSGDPKTNWSSRSTTARTEGELNVCEGVHQLGQAQAQRRPLKK